MGLLLYDIASPLPIMLQTGLFLKCFLMPISNKGATVFRNPEILNE